jgi:leader peptidase (prepilin peptidase)/N-methyltransferase
MEALVSAALWVAASALLLGIAQIRARAVGFTMLLTKRALVLLAIACAAAATSGFVAGRLNCVSTIMLACVAVSAVTDVETGYIFDAVTAPALGVILACAGLNGTAVAAIAGATLSGGGLYALHAVTRGRGIGLGDAKLGAVVGAGLGAALGAIALGIAFVTGAAIVLAGLRLRRISRRQSVPFGPYLACGAIASVLLHGVARG